MKKIFFLLLTTVILGTVSAQTTASTDTKLETKMMTKAEKQAAKEKKESDLVAAFKTAGMSTEEQAMIRASIDVANEKTKPIKADASLSPEDKVTKVAAIAQDRNEEMKTILGKEKYKAFKDAQKAQKEAAKQ